MSYVFGLGADAPVSSDPAVVSALARLRANYPLLRVRLQAEAATLTEPPSLSQRVTSWFSTENLDMDAAAGRSLLNAIQRYDETFAQVMAGDFSKAGQLQNNMETAIAQWGPNKDKPWSDLIQAIINDLKALPKSVGVAVGTVLRGAATGVAEGLGPWGMAAAAAGLAVVLYLASARKGGGSWINFTRKNPRRRAKGRK